MANKTRIRELGKLLNIQTVAWKKYSLEEQDGMSSLDFLEQVFERELEVRKQNAIKRNRRNANLPQVTLSKASLHEGILYQLNQLENCAWVETSQNLLITGKSSSGKTQIATHIASTAINLGYKVMYLSVDELLMIVKSKDTFQKAKLTHARMVAADMLVIDDFLYLDLKRDDLELLYKTLMSLKSTTSIVFVANREPQEWLTSAEDKYATDLLINRTVFSAIKMLLWPFARKQLNELLSCNLLDFSIRGG